MNTNDCPKLEKCPIFIKNVLHNEMVKHTYRSLYCQSTAAKFKSCKRFLFAEKYGKPAPESILPNSTLSIEEIATRTK